MNEKLAMIYQRRSIRKFQENQVDRDTLVELVKAGMAAPSACGNQPWEFVVVDDPEIMLTFRKRMTDGPYPAPAAIVVCHNPKVSLQPRCDAFWVQDCSAAVENILIAAVGLGLGTLWLGVYPREEKAAIVREIVHLPEDVIPLAVLYVGYPDEQKEARTKYVEDRVHWQHYQ